LHIHQQLLASGFNEGRRHTLELAPNLRDAVGLKKIMDVSSRRYKGLMIVKPQGVMEGCVRGCHGGS
jgi:hypothetical protein